MAAVDGRSTAVVAVRHLTTLVILIVGANIMWLKSMAEMLPSS